LNGADPFMPMWRGLGVRGRKVWLLPSEKFKGPLKLPRAGGGCSGVQAAKNKGSGRPTARACAKKKKLHFLRAFFYVGCHKRRSSSEPTGTELGMMFVFLSPARVRSILFHLPNWYNTAAKCHGHPYSLCNECTMALIIQSRLL